MVTPLRSVAPSDSVDDAALSTVRRLVAERRALVWLYTPMMLALADAFPGAPVVYDKMDELAKFKGADARIRAREDALLARATVVFSGGRSLYRTVAGRTARARCYPSGVDVAHFERTRSVPMHPDLPRAGGTLFGYVGVIDERIDLALIDALAQARADATIVMVGPVVKIDPASLPRRDNIVYLGARGYDELPSIFAGFSVALMPFAINEHTENISPTKTLEYLAAGLPVVSTAVADVVADHGDVVYVARDREEFVALVARAEQRDDVRAAAGARKVRDAEWSTIAEAMRDDLSAVGVAYAASTRPSSPARSSSAALP